MDSLGEIDNGVGAAGGGCSRDGDAVTPAEGHCNERRISKRRGCPHLSSFLTSIGVAS
jgi:hypothetical protein